MRKMKSIMPIMVFLSGFCSFVFYGEEESTIRSEQENSIDVILSPQRMHLYKNTPASISLIVRNKNEDDVFYNFAHSNDSPGNVRFVFLVKDILSLQ